MIKFKNNTDSNGNFVGSLGTAKAIPLKLFAHTTYMQNFFSKDKNVLMPR